MMKHLKKMISILMAIIMIMTVLTVPVSASSGYTDVSTSDSCYNAVIYLRDHNIMVGETDTYFGKNGNLIRADVVTILWRMLNKPNPYGMISSFPDCDPNAYYYNAVLWACSESVGIVSGYENGNFGPTDLVSNQDLLTFIYRFACYCGYTTNSTANQSTYLSRFNNSNLIYQNTFGEYSKVPVGWAVSTGFISDITTKGTEVATRGNTAKYVYHFYQRFQRKYGLTLTETKDYEPVYSSGLLSSIQSVYNYHNIPWVHYQDLTYAQFASAMNTAFGNAKKMDLCYLYIVAHGNLNPEGADHGIQLFLDNNEADKYLAPSELRQAIDAKNGIFVVMLETCYSGIFISNTVDIGDMELSEAQVAQLNAEAAIFIEDYVNELVASESNDMSDVSTMANGRSTLAESNKIKVLGSSRYFEQSQSSSFATETWKDGAGPLMIADFNNDGRISLHELYYHTNYMMSMNPATSLPVCYPENDNFIIFENHF